MAHVADHHAFRCTVAGLAVVVAILAAPFVTTPAPVHASSVAAAGGSKGCKPQASPEPSTQTIDVEGVARQYRLAVPAGSTGKRLLPLILNFHGGGAGSNADGQAVYSQLEEKGPARGFVVITPDVRPEPFWTLHIPNATGDSEEIDAFSNPAFTTALIDRAKASLCIDPQRIYATGFSLGGAMSVYLGCTLKPQLAAIAPVAGVNTGEPCPHGKPMSVIAFHGTADPNIAYEGGPGAVVGRPDIDLPSVETAAHVWAERAGCRTKPSRTSIGTEVERIAYRGCDSSTDVVLYAVTGGGHTWPGSTIEVPELGHTTQDINAADQILDFFSQHPPAVKNPKSRERSR